MNKSKVRHILCASVAAVAAITPFAAAAQQVHTESWGNGVERALVYRPGDYDSKFYRIPAIVTAKDGSLVTVADKR
ncbi:MAG: exo-alpha-sialidase, partial [Muribaculaceae bacterium]|nr:exo-alpha-sialidase [Muribaculaceae bacterium]